MTAAEIDSDSFIQNFAMSSEGEPVSEAAFAAWEGKLPGLLLALWQRDGFARYRDDKLALVDPHLYAEVATAFLQGNPMEGANTFHVYAVTAFGQILLCGENTSTRISIDPHSGHVTTESDVPDPADAAERNWKLAFAVSEGGWQAAHLVKRDRLAELKSLAKQTAARRSLRSDAEDR
ncbi:GAD-like domain-containing protein [Stenotrophomonas maltophilia]|uniref:GAD-like domain-containing protein n=1 Tax=Stenotrophomonas maltophilia TaxID=40324 RepID=UPI0023BADD94|nr:GAD-like domain-containing protein [Stenotrophomonas maltophilia]